MVFFNLIGVFNKIINFRNQAIVDYLESHGYNQTASVFRQEANVVCFKNFFIIFF